jgi:hypothetical protein
MLTLSNPTTLSWRRRLGWKPFSWNSNNINKVDPFSPFALLNRKQSKARDFLSFLRGFFFYHTLKRYDARNEKFSIHWKFILQQHSPHCEWNRQVAATFERIQRHVTYDEKGKKAEKQNRAELLLVVET